MDENFIYSNLNMNILNFDGKQVSVFLKIFYAYFNDMIYAPIDKGFFSEDR